MIRVMGTIYNGNRTEWSPILSGVQTRHWLYVFIKKILKKSKKKHQLTRRNARQQLVLMMRSVHIHRYDVLISL